MNKAKSQLDLYHAIVIIHQLSFLGLSTIPAGMYKLTCQRVFVHCLSMWATSTLFIAWWLYVWITSPAFGGDPNCNGSTIYVIFFRDVRTTAPWLRWLFVGTGCIAALLLIFSPVIASLNLMYAARVSSTDLYPLPLVERFSHSPPDDTEANTINGSITSLEQNTKPLAINSPLWLPTPLTGSRSRDIDGLWTDEEHGMLFDTPSHATRSRNLRDKSVQFPEKIARIEESFEFVTRDAIARLLFVTYGVVMLELTIKRNDVAPGESVWSFGQIVAVVIAIGGMNEVLNFFLGKEWEDNTAEAEQIKGM